MILPVLVFASNFFFSWVIPIASAGLCVRLDCAWACACACACACARTCACACAFACVPSENQALDGEKQYKSGYISGIEPVPPVALTTRPRPFLLLFLLEIKNENKTVWNIWGRLVCQLNELLVFLQSVLKKIEVIEIEKFFANH